MSLYSGCISISILIKTVCLATRFQFLWDKLSPEYISQRSLVQPWLFEYLLQLIVAKKVKEKQLCALINNLIQDDYSSFLLDTAQFSHSSREKNLNLLCFATT